MFQRNFAQGDAFAHRGVSYLDFMALLDRELAPRAYFEIGTDSGMSLKSFSCDAVCVDPNFQVQTQVWNRRRRTLMFQSTSDDFFAQENLKGYFPGGFDIAFLDGMHRAEYLLRDFINTERAAHPRSLILMHDCLPLNQRMAERVMRSGDETEGDYRNAWTGDVWRVLFALKRYRPELVIRCLDCPPTGLIAVSNPDPDSDVLDSRYDEVVASMFEIDLSPETMQALWSLFPFVDTQALARGPADISAVFNCR